MRSSAIVKRHMALTVPNTVFIATRSGIDIVCNIVVVFNYYDKRDPIVYLR